MKIFYVLMLLIIVCTPSYASSSAIVAGSVVGAIAANSTQASENADIAIKIEVCKANKSLDEVKKCLEQLAADKAAKNERDCKVIFWVFGFIIVLGLVSCFW